MSAQCATDGRIMKAALATDDATKCTPTSSTSSYASRPRVRACSGLFAPRSASFPRSSRRSGERWLRTPCASSSQPLPGWSCSVPARPRMPAPPTPASTSGHPLRSSGSRMRQKRPKKEAAKNAPLCSAPEPCTARERCTACARDAQRVPRASTAPGSGVHIGLRLKGSWGHVLDALKAGSTASSLNCILGPVDVRQMRQESRVQSWERVRHGLASPWER
mmetsp:Transcript_56003/g.131264  ORF Transcript_56003/g.131264 Transcript_56003/m.131264 type:complete len:220 (-) Transcript_56003:150-809(-)